MRLVHIEFMRGVIQTVIFTEAVVLLCKLTSQIAKTNSAEFVRFIGVDEMMLVNSYACRW